MTKRRNMSAETIRELIDYNPETGEFYWKPRSVSWFKDASCRTAEHNCRLWNERYAGCPAMTSVDSYGYREGRIFGMKISASRTAWKIVYGYEPENDIDHINLDKADNRIANLREATRSQNQWNHARRSDNTSGYKGVSRVKKTGRYHAYIRVNGKRRSLGFFLDAETAHEAYKQAAKELHGEFKNYG